MTDTQQEHKLAGVAELAEIFQVRRTTISQWHSRKDKNGFPDPIEVLAMGPVWDPEAVKEWWKGYKPQRSGKKVGSLPEDR